MTRSLQEPPVLWNSAKDGTMATNPHGAADAESVSTFLADDLDDLDVDVLEVGNAAIASLTSDHVLAEGGASCFSMPCWSCCCPTHVLPIGPCGDPPILAATPQGTQGRPMLVSQQFAAFDEETLQAWGEQLNLQGQALLEAAKFMRAKGQGAAASEPPES